MLMAALFFGIVLPLIPACSGGCGEEPQSKSQEQPSTGASAPSGGGGGGSGPQQLGAKSGGGKGVADGPKGSNSRFDSTNGKNGSTGAMGQAGETAGQSAPDASGPVAPVSPNEFRGKLLGQGAAKFLTVIGQTCPDCDTVMPVINTLAPDFSSSFEFYQYDGTALGASGMLPKDMSLSPLPAFAMYKDGKVTSLLQGMPFPMQVDAAGKPTETKEQYQARLLRWFRDALTQKNLNFSRTIRKKAPKKD